LTEPAQTRASREVTLQQWCGIDHRATPACWHFSLNPVQQLVELAPEYFVIVLVSLGVTGNSPRRGAWIVERGASQVFFTRHAARITLREVVHPHHDYAANGVEDGGGMTAGVGVAFHVGHLARVALFQPVAQVVEAISGRCRCDAAQLK